MSAILLISKSAGKLRDIRGPSINKALPLESRFVARGSGCGGRTVPLLGFDEGDGIRPSEDAEKASDDPGGRRVLSGCKMRLPEDRVRL
jgi:hypothetical protein